VELKKEMEWGMFVKKIEPLAKFMCENCKACILLETSHFGLSFFFMGSLSMKKKDPFTKFACVRKLFKKLGLTPKQSSYVFG
jgi:hypothetical protein